MAKGNGLNAPYNPKSVRERTDRARTKTAAHGNTPCWSLGCVRYIPVCPGDHRVRSCAFDPFPRAVGVVGFVRVRSLHSLASRGSRVLSCALGPFPCTPVAVRFVRVRSRHFRVRVRSVHSRALWGLFWYVRSIPGDRRVR